MDTSPAPLSGGQLQPASTPVPVATPLSGAQSVEKGTNPLLIVGAAALFAIIIVGILAMTPIGDTITGGSSSSGALTASNIQELNYMEIKTLGEPVSCDVESIQGEEIAMSIKILGDNTRIDVVLPERGKTVTVVKNGEIYNELSGGIAATFADSGIQVDCDWLFLDDETPVGVPDMPSEDSIDSLSEILSTEMNCEAGNFGKEIFATAGKVCTMSDLEDML